MILYDRIIAFEKLGKIISDSKSNFLSKNIIAKAEANNPWFIESHIRFSIFSLSLMLNPAHLSSWMNSYDIVQSNKKVGVIIPSNIPFVGFYDFLSIILSGNHFIGKLSSSNNILLPHLSKLLFDINPDLTSCIDFKQEINKEEIDILIATGDDNSATYFNYKYANTPKLIRKHRNSVCILNGSEKLLELEKFSLDVYMYFGLGCRNVSKIFIPRNFDLQILQKIFNSNDVLLNQNYMEVYSYQKSVFEMHNENFIDFGNLLLVESDKLNAPVSVLYYQFYDNIDEVINYIKFYKNNIQCVVSNDSRFKNSISLGNSQLPRLEDFPDDVDVVNFLSKN
tara:strand:- start:2835 stop:3848 length:1014 start_codon:yes stop_codon:yes gene_type:complete